MTVTSRRTCSLLLLLLWLLIDFSAAVVPPGAYPGSVHDSSSSSKRPQPGSSNNGRHKRSRTAFTSSNRRQRSNSDSSSSSNKKEKKSWSSMLTVDPAKILSHLIHRGGLVLPKDAAKQIDIARKCLGVEQAELNVLSKDLILYNFTIGLDPTLPALRVAKAQVSWDSYLRPTLDVLVEDVNVLVEFTNLMLAENNWNEIRASGFPPSILMDQAGMSDDKKESASKDKKLADDSAFVRFHSIDLKGSCTIRIMSRPLSNKEIGTMTLDFKELRGLSREIQALSDSHLQRTGRAGCTPDELSRTIQHFFDQRLRQFIKTRVEELAKDPKAAMRQAEGVASRATGSVLDYVQQAGRYKGDELENSTVDRLKNWGIPNPGAAFSAIKERALYGVEKLNVTAVREHVNKEAANVMDSLQEMRDSLRNLDQREDETEFVFADW